MKNLALLLAVLALPAQAIAWSGYDYDQGSFVDIDRGNTVRPGRDIEIYDYNGRGYHDVEVTDIRQRGSHGDVEVYDPSTGQNRTLEMNRR